MPFKIHVLGPNLKTRLESRSPVPKSFPQSIILLHCKRFSTILLTHIYDLNVFSTTVTIVAYLRVGQCVGRSSACLLSSGDFSRRRYVYSFYQRLVNERINITKTGDTLPGFSRFLNTSYQARLFYCGPTFRNKL